MGSDSQSSEAVRDRENLGGLWIRCVFIVFPVIAFMSIVVVNCMCWKGSVKALVMIAANSAIFLRLLVWMIRRERRRILVFYLCLPFILAVVTHGIVESQIAQE